MTFTSSAGWIACVVSAQSRVTGVPPTAAASSAPPVGNPTQTESPRGGAQFGRTVNVGGSWFRSLAPKYVVPREKNGGGKESPRPTPMRIALAPVAAIESSTDV